MDSVDVHMCTTRATVHGRSLDRYAPQNAGRRS